MQLTRSLVEMGRIETTLAKAKAVQPMVEKLITKAKSGGNAALSEIMKTLGRKSSYEKLLEMARTRFTARNSGYTRIVKLGVRKGDAGMRALLEFVDAAPAVEVKKAEKKGKNTKDTNKKPEIQDAEVVKEADQPKRIVGKPKAARSTVK